MVSSLLCSKRWCFEVPSDANHEVSFFLLELVQRDGKIAHTQTCRVIDGVGNRRRYADEANLPQPFDSDGVEGEVRFVDMASWVFPSSTLQIAATMLG